MSGALRGVRARLGLRVLGQCADGEGRDSEVHPRFGVRSDARAPWCAGRPCVPQRRSDSAGTRPGERLRSGDPAVGAGTRRVGLDRHPSAWLLARIRRRSETRAGCCDQRPSRGEDARCEGGWGEARGAWRKSKALSRSTERGRLWAAKAAREHTGVCKDGQRNAVGSVGLRAHTPSAVGGGRGLSRCGRAVTDGTREPRRVGARFTPRAPAVGDRAPPSRAGCPSSSPSCCRARAASWPGGR